MNKKAVAALAGSAALLALCIVLSKAYFRWSEPLGVRNMERCPLIKRGATRDDLVAALGNPTNTTLDSSGRKKWLYFETLTLAAGQIRAQELTASGRIIRLRCSEDGPDTWNLE